MGIFHKRLPAAILLTLLMVPVISRASPTFANGVSQGTVAFPELKEASGIVASRNNANVLWMHNDSGDSARIYAIDTQGKKLGNYNLPGATNIDYEDIGMGPGPVTNVLYIYVGDIGDNNAVRSNITVYQIPEPAVYGRQATNPITANLKGVRSITLNYPDGPVNAEALFVDPWTGDLFIATKQTSITRIYTVTKAALDANDTNILTFVRQLNFDIVSGADISPTGKEIILRRESHAELWTRAPGQTISNALAGTSVLIPVIGTPTEPNGEAIGFDYDGSGYYTLSDDSTSQPLYYFARTSADGPGPAPRILVAAGSSWKYLDDGSNQETAWRDAVFNDASWFTGTAPLGYGNGNERTMVSYGPSATNKYVTTYFRTSFQLANPTSITNLTVKLLCDNGASVYLNGTPVLHNNLDSNAVHNTFATAAQTTLADTWFSYSLDPALLVNGSNTLAVEVHQPSATNATLRFDLQLLAQESPVPQITAAAFSNAQFQMQISGASNSSITIQATTNLATNWATLGTLTLTNGTGIFTDTQAGDFTQRFYRAAK